MNTTDVPGKLHKILQALDALEEAGYVFWVLDEDALECSQGQHVVEFQDFPEVLPILPGEIELLASVFTEIMALGASDP